ncbi:hypothetical protein ACQEUU_00915 [Nonomuraea sp. CA-218870]|uniref:hypothetical protein n=1 Tax=Nonomuraea sp. CA-218870 TaxID=3239998 RepID=UPI003D8B89AA
MSSEPVLPAGWQEFVAKPDQTTAKAVAKALAGMKAPAALGSVKLIAEKLAERSAAERSEKSRLIAAQLMGEVAHGFMKATAATRLAHPTVRTPAQKPAPQHEDVAHYLDVLRPKELDALPETTPGGHDPLTLEALDLADADLARLADRIADEHDASSMGHLRKAAELVDSINGRPTTYSQERRAELAPTVKGTKQEHLVEQIGFRAAKTQRDKEQGLSAQNELAASYWRTNYVDTLQKFLTRLGNVLPDPDGILVNSPRVLEKLAMMVDPKVVAGLRIKPVAGRTGVSVLSGTSAFADIAWKSILQELGATPSAYQLYELMDTGKQDPPADPTVDTWADLVALITGSPFARLQEMARQKTEPAPVCAMVEHLVLGLTDEFGPKRADALTANALRSLGRLLDILVANQHNPTVALRAVDLMMDEIAIVVAVAQNYYEPDYRHVVRQVLLERAPSIATPVEQGQVQLTSYLTTSGMEALGTALWIALSWRGHEQVSRSTEQIDYFETGELLRRLRVGDTLTPHQDVLVATLNPSAPYSAPSPDVLVAAVREALTARKGDAKPCVLIIDTTIQLAPRSTGGRGRLDVILDGLKEDIAAGRLEVFLCKSYQKYASFGTGKVAAGDLTLLSKQGNLESVYARAEALLQGIALDLARHDEGQLVIHMLRHGHRDELALVESAAGNAKFVDEFCWPIDRMDQSQGTTYVEGIPLLLRATSTGKVDTLFGKLALIDWRDSFSFLRTSYVGRIPGPWGAPPEKQQEAWYVRINPGHEPKETMVECFYAFGHLATSTPPGADKPSQRPVDLDRLTLEAVREHLTALDGVRSDAGVNRYRTNIAASYCVFAVQNVGFHKDGLVPLLGEFFAKRTGGVTIETQRYLAGELFSLLKGRTLDVALDKGPAMPPPPAGSGKKVLSVDRTTVGGLCRAAAVLPAWRLTSLAKGFELGRIGDSDEAARLRALVEKAQVQGQPS